MLTEDDSGLKVASQITFEGLVAYKSIGNKKECKGLQTEILSKENSSNVVSQIFWNLSM